eukprot:365032-Chlamydomonas_euryale.AAC.18
MCLALFDDRVVASLAIAVNCHCQGLGTAVCVGTAHFQRILRHMDLGECAAATKILRLARHKVLAPAVRRHLLHGATEP